MSFFTKEYFMVLNCKKIQIYSSIKKLFFYKGTEMRPLPVMVFLLHFCITFAS